jgi:hypothetical protein
VGPTYIDIMELHLTNQETCGSRTAE